MSHRTPEQRAMIRERLALWRIPDALHPSLIRKPKKAIGVKP